MTRYQVIYRKWSSWHGTHVGYASDLEEAKALVPGASWKKLSTGLWAVDKPGGRYSIWEVRTGEAG